jgi:hypothetical protein
VRVEDGDDDHHVAEDDDEADEAERHQRPDHQRVLEVDVVEGRRAVVLVRRLKAGIVKAGADFIKSVSAVIYGRNLIMLNSSL